MSIDDTGAGADPGGTDTSGTDTSGTDTSGTDTSGTDTSGTDTSGTDTSGTDTSGGTDQDQAKAEVRAKPQVDDSLASVGAIPNDPAAEVAQFDTNFDGSEVA